MGMQAVPRQRHPGDAGTLALPSPFAAAPWYPQSTFGHCYPSRHDLPGSLSLSLPPGDWHRLTLGPCPLSPQGDVPGPTAPSGRGHPSPSPGHLSSRAASIRRKLQTSGGWWGTTAPGAQLGSLWQRRRPPPAGCWQAKHVGGAS